MRLIDAQHIRSSNLQLTKFIAAIMVIISHSFVLCTGSVSGDWIYRISDGQLTMGYVAVSIFFLCGGFLIAKSAERLSTFSSYWKTRALRIFPPLFFTVILCIVIGGLFLTQLPPKQYWTAPQTWRYLFKCTPHSAARTPGSVCECTIQFHSKRVSLDTPSRISLLYCLLYILQNRLSS